MAARTGMEGRSERRAGNPRIHNFRREESTMTGISPEQVAQLAAPFPPESIHWRAQSVVERDGKHKALALAYLDARDVQDRLDGVCGPENWSDSYVETPKGRIIGTITINIEGAWIGKSDGAGDTDV